MAGHRQMIEKNSSGDKFSPAARWLATFAVLSAFFTSIFTSTMVNVAIPNVMGAFGVGQDQAQFLSSAFLAMNTTGLLGSSWLIAKIGQRRTFFLVQILFAATGCFCFVAPNLELLILGRVTQGFAAGLLQPLVMLTLFQVFPIEKRGLAMGMFSMGVTVALGLGPSIGGIVIDLFNWRAIFLAPLPGVVLAVLLGMFFLPADDQKMAAGRFDSLGFVLINVTVFCWFMLLGNGQRWGWDSSEILILAGVTVICGFGFAASQLRRVDTLIDVTIFSNKRFVMVLAISFLFGFGNFATVYAFPIFGQIVQNFTPTVAGSMLLPGSLFAALVLPLTGRLADKASPIAAMIIGVVIIAISVWMLAGADPNTIFWYVAFSLLLGRVGSAFVSPAVNTTALGALNPSQVRRGAGVANLSLMLGGSTGISVYVLLLERRIEFHAVNLGVTQTAANSSTGEMISALSGPLSLAGLNGNVRDGLALDYLGRVVTGQANMLGFQDGFVTLTIIALLPLIPILFLLWSGRRH